MQGQDTASHTFTQVRKLAGTIGSKVSHHQKVPANLYNVLYWN